MRKLAFYGGSFDPVHNGHLAVAHALIPLFELEAFVFIPAYHAPHKPEQKPASAFHRFAMLCLATEQESKMLVSTIEVESNEKQYTIDTLSRLHEAFPDSAIYFVMGADSWRDIRTWKDWEKVLIAANHIIVSRPGYEIGFDHVTDSIRETILDLRGKTAEQIASDVTSKNNSIYITDTVELPISATAIRHDARDGEIDQQDGLPDEVAKYIEKYELYR